MDARLAARVVVLAALAWIGSAHSRAFDHSHRAWDALLKEDVIVVDGGKASRVRYASLAREHARLRAYLDSLSAVQRQEYDRWDRQEQMAFLINAYNAFTVEKVLTRYPDLRSIRDFGRIFGNPFKDRFFRLLGEPASLDDIEQGMLRRRFREPRVHFALNCASVGCPMLREEAYVAGRLDAQLEEQAVRFLSDRSRNRFSGGHLEVSKIFDWYGEDFEPRAVFFARYARALADEPAARKRIEEGKAPVSFLDYDWSLNDSR